MDSVMPIAGGLGNSAADPDPFVDFVRALVRAAGIGSFVMVGRGSMVDVGNGVTDDVASSVVVVVIVSGSGISAGAGERGGEEVDASGMTGVSSDILAGAR